jgi:HSP20 family protein
MRYIQFTHPSRGIAATAGFGGRLTQAGFEGQLDWLFGTALDGFAGQARNGQFPVDIYEDNTNAYVRAELPGVAREGISVEIVDGALSIQASRKGKAAGGEDTVQLRRLVSIPDEVQGDKVSAAYENGILTVTLPRSEEAKPRKINVSVN